MSKEIPEIVRHIEAEIAALRRLRETASPHEVDMIEYTIIELESVLNFVRRAK